MRRTLAVRGALLFSARLLPAAALFAVNILLSHHTDKSFVGRYSGFYATLGVFLAFTGAGISAFSISFTAGSLSALAAALPRRVYLLFGAFVAACAVGFGYLQQQFLPLWLPAALLLVNTAGILAEAYLLAGQKFRSVLLLNGMYALGFFSLHYAYVVSFFSWFELILGVFGMLSLRLVVLLGKAVILWRSQTPDTLVLPEGRGDVRKLWLHLGLYDALQQAYRWIDKAAVALVMPLALSAIYFNGATEVPFLPLLLGAAGSSALSFFATGRPHQADQVAAVRYLGTVLSGVIFPLGVFLWIFSYPLFEVAFTDRYADSVAVFRVMLLYLPLRAYPFTALLQQERKGGVILRGAVLDLLLLLLLLWPGYRLAGFPGVAAAYVLSTWMQAGYYLWHAGKATARPPLTLLPGRSWLLRGGLTAALAAILFLIRELSQSPVAGLIFGAGITALAMLFFLLKDLQIFTRYGRKQ